MNFEQTLSPELQNQCNTFKDNIKSFLTNNSSIGSQILNIDVDSTLKTNNIIAYGILCNSIEGYFLMESEKKRLNETTYKSTDVFVHKTKNFAVISMEYRKLFEKILGVDDIWNNLKHFLFIPPNVNIYAEYLCALYEDREVSPAIFTNLRHDTDSGSSDSNSSDSSSDSDSDSSGSNETINSNTNKKRKYDH
jgi:hypothetical protein